MESTRKVFGSNLEIYHAEFTIFRNERNGTGKSNGVWRVFVKNLDRTIDSKILVQTFSAFGRILSTKVVRDEQGVSMRYGYVVFLNEDDANTAIQEANGMLMGDRNVIVEKFLPKKDRSVSHQYYFF